MSPYSSTEASNVVPLLKGHPVDLISFIKNIGSCNFQQDLTQFPPFLGAGGGQPKNEFS